MCERDEDEHAIWRYDFYTVMLIIVFMLRHSNLYSVKCKSRKS